MEDMTVTVAMTTDDFLEFVAWRKERDYYKSRLDKEHAAELLEMAKDYLA